MQATRFGNLQGFKRLDYDMHRGVEAPPHHRDLGASAVTFLRGPSCGDGQEVRSPHHAARLSDRQPHNVPLVVYALLQPLVLSTPNLSPAT
jgi:hypothetical protein